MFRPTQVLQTHCTHTGLSPTMVRLSKRFWLYVNRHWPGPLSLATTQGVSIDFRSSGYLDVSVPRVCLDILYIQMPIPLNGGFPHSDIPGSKPIGGSSGLNAAYHVLHRLSVPRHPPNALNLLHASPPHAVTKITKDTTWWAIST